MGKTKEDFILDVYEIVKNRGRIKIMTIPDKEDRCFTFVPNYKLGEDLVKLVSFFTRPGLEWIGELREGEQNATWNDDLMGQDKYGVPKDYRFYRFKLDDGILEVAVCKDMSPLE